MIRPFFGSRRMIDSAVVVFPQPLSPASPRLSPFSSFHETSSTARTVPERVSKYVLRWSTSIRAVPSPLAEFRVQDLIEGVAEQREAQDDDDEGEPRHDDPRPPSVEGSAAGLRFLEDDAPAQGADVNFPQEGESRLREDRDRDRQDRVCEDQGENVREDVLPKNRRVARPGRLRAFDEDALLDGQDLGPHDPGREVPTRQADGEDDDIEAQVPSEDLGQDDEESEPGKGEQDVVDPHEDLVVPSAGEARNQADRGSEDAGDDARQKSNEEGHTRPPDDAGQDVTPHLVRAERVLP